MARQGKGGTFRRGAWWWIRYKDAAGRWRRESADTQNRLVAQDAYHAALERVRRELAGQGGGEMTFGEAAAKHQASVGGGPARKKQVRWALGYAAPLRQLQLRAVKPSHVLEILRGLSHLGDWSRREVVVQVRAVYVYAADVLEAWQGRNPARGRAFSFPIRRSEPVSMAAPEVAAILTALDEVIEHHGRGDRAARTFPRWWGRPFFTFLAYTGCRTGEAVACRKEDVDLSAGVVTLRRSYERNSRKTGRALRLPIHQELAAVLERLMREATGPLLFPEQDGSLCPRERAQARTQDLMQRALKLAGLGGRGYSPKTFRKTAATLLGDVVAASQLLGHASTAITRKHYFTPNPEDLRERLSQRLQFGLPSNQTSDTRQVQVEPVAAGTSDFGRANSAPQEPPHAEPRQAERGPGAPLFREEADVAFVHKTDTRPAALPLAGPEGRLLKM